VSELPAGQREAVRAHVLEDRDYGDIAREEMTTEATVRKRVSRGLSALRARAGGIR
jgi:RNA polymerase sigma-70 factor (ECF subfamily)